MQKCTAYMSSGYPACFNGMARLHHQPFHTHTRMEFSYTGSIGEMSIPWNDLAGTGRLQLLREALVNGLRAAMNPTPCAFVLPNNWPSKKCASDPWVFMRESGLLLIDAAKLRHPGCRAQPADFWRHAGRVRYEPGRQLRGRKSHNDPGPPSTAPQPDPHGQHSSSATDALALLDQFGDEAPGSGPAVLGKVVTDVDQVLSGFRRKCDLRYQAERLPLLLAARLLPGSA